MIKVVMADMDGTLLNEYAKITERTATAVKEFQKRGGLFVINTGRSYQTASSIVKEAGIDCDYICLSGAGIYDHNGRCIWKDSMDVSSVLIVREIEKKYNLYVNYLTEIGVCSERTKKEGTQYYLNEAIAKANFSELEITVTEAFKRYQNIIDIVRYEQDIDDIIKKGIPIYKMAIVAGNGEELENANKELNSYKGLKVVSSDKYSVEVNSSRVDKGAAALQYIRDKGFSMEEMMVIGDNENDLAMLSLPFGCTIAMGNASEPIKHICLKTTLTNAEDGVAYAIEQWT